MNIDVTKDEVIIDKNSDKAHENEYRITECEFVFDVFTNSFQVKRAIFTILSTGEMYEVDIINNKCNIPSEVLKHAYETVKLGVYGYNIGENDELLNRFSPSYAEFVVPTGSYEEGALSPEPITPSQYDLYSQALQEGLQEVDDKLDEVVETVDGKIEEVDTKLGEVDSKLDEVDGKIQDVDTAISNTNDAIDRTNNLNLDVSDKVDGDVTVTLTKKDASTKSVVISDGTSLQFMWQGTSLGIKTDDMEEYVFVDLQGIQGIKGDTGEPFTIKKTYSSVAEMNADFNNMEYGDYVMIASSVEVEDNAKLYTRGESQWIFITDFSGATGIRGPVGATPNIQIGSVTSGSNPSVTRTGTDENPILNFVLQPGPQGEVGPTGLTGNGISSITKTGTSGLVDTYTITFTNGNTTTFDVTNGKGIDRIEKTATVGNIDTYTIYFNDNSTSTFEVANGEVTREELEEEVDRLSMIYNLFPTTSDEDTEMTLDGTGEVKLKKIGLKGNTYQYSTTGKNKINIAGGDESGSTTLNGLTFKINNDGSITISGTSNNSFSFPINYTTVTPLTLGSNYFYSIKDSQGNDLPTSLFQVEWLGVNNNKKYNYGSANNIDGIKRVRIYGDSGKTINGTYYFQIEEGVSYTNWEKYTGNQPSPNPDYPQDIQVVTGDNEVKVEGKNLFKIPFENGSANGITWTINENGSITLNGTSTSHVNINSSSLNIPVIEGETYTISATNISKGNIGFKELNGTDIWVLNAYSLTKTKIITSDMQTTNVKFSIYIPPNNTFNNVTITFQLEKGSQATTYEAYKGQTYPVNLGSIELCKIEDYQDKIAKSTGKNLFDKDNANIYNGYIGSSDNHQITSSNNSRTLYMPCDANTTYTISKVQSSYFRTGYTHELPTSGVYTYGYNDTGITSTTLTTDSSAKYLVLTFWTNNDTLTKQQILDSIMINKGNIALPYEPYGKVWYLNKQIGKVVLDGSENWNYFSVEPSGLGRAMVSSSNVYYNSTQNTIMANNMVGVEYTGSWNKTYDCIATLSNNRFIAYLKNASDLSTFKSILSNSNSIVYYVLETPTITEITDTTLIEQLDNLENAYSYDTQTNITQTNDDMPFILDVEALMSLKGVLN